MMETIIKLTKDDIITRACGLNVSIDTTRDDVMIIFDADAAVEFANDIMALIPGGFDGSGNLTPRPKPEAAKYPDNVFGKRKQGVRIVATMDDGEKLFTDI